MLNVEPSTDEKGFLSERQSTELPRWPTLAGQTLGAYVIERPLGQGGMGSVWLARRNDGRFEGVAAIKFLSLALAGTAGEERFRREGNALARLTHPNIARLLDAGLSQIGLPYLVLEYVEGQPIDEWCDARTLSVEGRLRLFQQVLAAVADAHAHFIVHRDLKPANIVVTILDTESGSLSRAMTPSGSHTREEVERLAAARDASPERLRRVFAGDLDNIVAKSLKKKASERYPTVGAMADDVRHYLGHEPVSARADSFGYRAGKFVRRHRVTVGAAVLIAGALVGAALREARLRSRAESETRKAVAVEEYLVSIFGAADPFAPTADKPSEVTARALLDRGAERIDTSLANQPDVRAELRGALGGVYMNLGVYDKATKELRQSLAERRALYGRDNASVAQAMDQLGDVLTKVDSFTEADTLLRGALAIRRKLFGENSDATAQSLDHLAELLDEKDDFPAAEPLYRSALRIRRELHGDSDLTVATSRVSLGELLLMRSENTEAIGEFRQALAIRERLLGPSHPATAEAIRRMARAEQGLGRYAEAEQHYRQALTIDRKALGNDHRNVSAIYNDLGLMLFKMGRLDEADSLLREALAINRKLFGENHDAVSGNLSNLAIVVRERGDFDEAERLLEEALAIDQRLYGPEHVNIGFDLNEMAVVLRLEGRPDSAVRMLRRALAINRKLAGDDELGTLVISINLGRALTEARQYAEAERLMRGSLAKLDTTNMDAQMGIIPGRTGMGRVLLATHRAKEAVPAIEGAVEMSEKRLGADHWRTGEAQLVLAECLMALGDYTKAAQPLREGSDILEKNRKSHPGLAKEAEGANMTFARLRTR